MEWDEKSPSKFIGFGVRKPKQNWTEKEKPRVQGMVARHAEKDQPIKLCHRKV